MEGTVLKPCLGGSKISPPGPIPPREGQRSGRDGGFSCLIVVYRDLLGRSKGGAFTRLGPLGVIRGLGLLIGALLCNTPIISNPGDNHTYGISVLIVVYRVDLLVQIPRYSPKRGKLSRLDVPPPPLRARPGGRARRGGNYPPRVMVGI